MKGQAKLTQQYLKFALLIAASFMLVANAGAQQVSAPDPRLATIIGTVIDVNGGVVPNATVVLKSFAEQSTVTANDNGFFQLSAVKAGIEYRVSASAPDFTVWTSGPVTLAPGQYFILPDIRLRLATVQISVVALTPEQMAVEQVRQEEKQHVLGLVPDFYINYDTSPAPMSSKLKFRLALRTLADRVTLAGFALDAGFYQAGSYPGYRGGMAGYGQRLGAVVAGGLSTPASGRRNSAVPVPPGSDEV